MRTMRNLAFVALLATVLMTGRASIAAAPNCPGDCYTSCPDSGQCTTDSWENCTGICGTLCQACFNEWAVCYEWPCGGTGYLCMCYS
jgi:hypothetical protein